MPQARRGNIADLLLLYEHAQGVQGMVDVAERGVPGLAAMIVNSIHSEQVDDVMSIRTHPGPQSAGLWMPGLAVVAKILVHHRHALAQLQRQAVMKVIIGSYALDNDFCTAKQQVSAQFMNHDNPPFTVPCFPLRCGVTSGGASPQCASAVR